MKTTRVVDVKSLCIIAYCWLHTCSMFSNQRFGDVIIAIRRAEFPRVGRSAASSRMGVDGLSGERSDWVGLVGFNLSWTCCPLGRSLF